MTRTQRMLLKLLALVLAALAAAAVIRLALNYREARREAAEAAALAEEGSAAQARGYTALTYSNGSTTLNFALDDAGKWTWADDPAFPLDDTTVTAILDLLTSLKFQQTLANEEGLESYGLDAPAATVTASGDTASLTLDFGKTTTDGDSHYVMLDGSEETVYIIADTLYKLMCVPIYDMMDLPALPSLTADTIDIISIHGTATTTIRAIRPEEEEKDAKAEEGPVTWRSGGANVTDSPAVASLLEELEDLRFIRCVDYKPSDDAANLCGFAEPAVTLSVIYLREGGAEQTLLLTLGGHTLDDTGYYARINEDTAIYQVDSEAVTALLDMAANGL